MTQYFVVAKHGIMVNKHHELPNYATSHFKLADGAQPIELINVEQHPSLAKVYAVDAAHCHLPCGFQEVSLRDLLNVWSRDKMLLAFKASQLVRWQRDHGFCSRCGTRTQFAKHESCAVCENCDYHQYPRLQPCVIVAITKNTPAGKQILLAKSAQAHKAFYSLIAGFVEVGESLEEAVAREVMEETQLKVKNIRYLGSQPWPFPSNIMVGFVADYASGEIVIAQDELSDAKWHTPKALPTIPPKGTIANSLINHVCFGEALDL